MNAAVRDEIEHLKTLPVQQLAALPPWAERKLFINNSEVVLYVWRTLRSNGEHLLTAQATRKLIYGLLIYLSKAEGFMVSETGVIRSLGADELKSSWRGLHLSNRIKPYMHTAAHGEIERLKALPLPQLTALPPLTERKRTVDHKKIDLFVWHDLLPDGEHQLVVHAARQTMRGVVCLGEGFAISSTGVARDLNTDELKAFWRRLSYITSQGKPHLYVLVHNEIEHLKALPVQQLAALPPLTERKLTIDHQKIKLRIYRKLLPSGEHQLVAQASQSTFWNGVYSWAEGFSISSTGVVRNSDDAEMDSFFA
ncbi:MAG: hypothetical protein LBP52_04775 [Burkholderiaceae bacterium]|nr:hypothetical protein [Burkholderiaceae bacterium]